MKTLLNSALKEMEVFNCKECSIGNCWNCEYNWQGELQQARREAKEYLSQTELEEEIPF